MGIINLKNVSKQYGDKIILQDVNLEIAVGSFVVLRGASGAGKSTLLNLISGLEMPTNGQVIVDERDIRSLSAGERINFYRHEVGIIFQGSYLQPQLTLMENITLPGVFANMPSAERSSRAEQLAKMLGIFDNLEFLPKEVSGGQAERACIARALLLSPKIVLADEPTSNLDDKNAEIILEILDFIRRQMNITVIVASHNRDALKFATRVVMIENQRVKDDVQGSN